MPRPDPHSVFDDAQPRVRHLDWRVRVDFSARVLEAEAHLVLDGHGAVVDLDSRDLIILRVEDGAGASLPFEHGPPHPVLGQRLRVECGAARALRVVYRTAPAATALQWFNQSVYSQCQPIYARTLVPLPDSPSARLTMRVQLTAPRQLTALMGGELVERREDEDGAHATTTYEMVEPIAPYLLALAVGQFVARDLTPRTRVWAAPEQIEDAARVLAGIGRTLQAAERLLGPYRWRRFDLWIAPPSFPYGGMENPRLTFLSPSLLVRDGSLLGVVAHELCHAWFGNLVGAASVEHLWINEGLAVYAERRLIEQLDGEPAAQLQAAIGHRDLDRTLAAFAARPELTQLHTRLEGLDPDEALSIVPYEKGYLLLCALEAELGREALDRLLRAYLDRFAGQAITSDELAAFLAAAAPDFPFEQWLNQSGLPASVPPAVWGAASAAPAPAGAPSATSSLANATSPASAPYAPTETSTTAGTTGPAEALPSRDDAALWSPWQWRWYLEGLPRPSSLCATLDEWFNLSASENAEVRAVWLPLAIESNHAPALATIEQALDAGSTRGGGRIKFLRPLYMALARNPLTRDRVGGWWRRFRDGYHPVARQQLDRLLRELGIATQDVNPLGLRRRP